MKSMNQEPAESTDTGKPLPDTWDGGQYLQKEYMCNL